MSTIVSTNLSTPGLRAEFLERFAATQTVWQDLATRIQSNTDSEKYGWLGAAPPMREWGTGREARGIFNETYDIQNLKYEASISVDRDTISDDQTGAVRIRIGELAERAAMHKDAEIFRLLINGGSTGFNSYDGVTFFASTHQSGKSASQSNLVTPAAVSASVPTVAEIRAGLKAAIAQLLSLTDDQAEPMNQDASGLVVCVAPAVYLDFLEAINASIVSSTSTTNPLISAARVIASARLTSASVFYLLKTNMQVRPFVLQDREPIEFGSLEGDSETGFIKEKYIYGVRTRYRMTYGYWQRAVRGTFTQS